MVLPGKKEHQSKKKSARKVSISSGPRSKGAATAARRGSGGGKAAASVKALAPVPRPAPLPPGPDLNARATLLMAMGLFDEAADQIPKRYGLRPMSNALTQSLALNHGNASRDSIYAIEVLMASVPPDFVPELLPLTVRQLLYPRYFFDSITEDSKRFGADPYLVLSIMREESRFNPRAKSEAAARGLLQFIITTARDIGREVGIVSVAPDDLYDPRIIIRLGAKYISTLSQRFHDDQYDVAGAYNAGPNQVALWSRLAPGAGDDFYLSSVNFNETKDYIRKVMNSYRRYQELYGNGAPVGCAPNRRARRSSSARQLSLDRLAQGARPHRFGEVLIDLEVAQRLMFVARILVKPADDDHTHRRHFLFGHAGDFAAIDVRHEGVRDDDLRQVLAGQPHCLFAVNGGDDPVAGGCDYPAGDSAADGVVIRKEDCGAPEQLRGGIRFSLCRSDFLPPVMELFRCFSPEVALERGGGGAEAGVALWAAERPHELETVAVGCCHCVEGLLAGLALNVVHGVSRN